MGLRSGFAGAARWLGGRDWQGGVQRAKGTAELVGILLAGGFFAYKVWDGWLSSNMSLDLRTERSAASGGFEHLAILLEMEKGATGSVYLRTAEARVACPSHPAHPVRVVGLVGGTRVGFDPPGTIRWDRAGRKLYHISASESLQVAGLTSIPAGAVCTVEVVVIAPRDSHFRDGSFAQWQATTVTFPAASAAEAETGS